MSEMEWAPIKCLFWNANDPVGKSMVSIISGVSLWYRPCHTDLLNYDNDKNAESLRQCKSRSSLIAEQTLAFASLTNLVREVKNLSPNFKRIA